MYKILILVLVIVGLTSCSTVLGLFLGISEPSDISENQMKKCLLDNGLDTNMLFVLKPNCFYALQDTSYNINKFDTTYSPIQYRVYKGKNGVFLGSWQICYGSLNKIGFLDNVPPVDNKNRFIINSSLSYSNDLEIIRPINNIYPDITEYDYVIIAYWADYLGRPSIKMLKLLESYISNHSEYSFLLIKVYLAESVDK